MRLNWFATVIFGILIGSLNGQSQEDTLLVSLNDCIQIALEKNPDIKIQRNTAQVSANNYRGSYSAVLPGLSASYSASKQEGFRELPDPSGIIKLIKTKPIHNYRTQFSVSQNIFDGGKWWSQIRRGQFNKNREAANLNEQVNQIITTITETYLDVLKQEKLLEVKRIAVQRSQGELEKNQQMFKIGSVAKVDLYRSKGTLGNDRINLIKQRNSLKGARQRLNVSLGYPPEQLLKIYDQVKFEYRLPPLEDVLDAAFESQPALKRLEMDIRSKQAEVAISRSVLIPSLRGFWEYGRSRNSWERFRRNFSRDWNSSLGIQGSWSLFNGLQNHIGVQNSKIALKNSQIQLESYKRNLASRVKMLYQSHQDLAEIIKINKENLKAAREEYRLATERFRLGAGTSLDIREAQVNLTTAEQALVSAEYDLVVNYARLQNATGRIQEAVQKLK